MTTLQILEVSFVWNTKCRVLKNSNLIGSLLPIIKKSIVYDITIEPEYRYLGILSLAIALL